MKIMKYLFYYTIVFLLVIIVCFCSPFRAVTRNAFAVYVACSFFDGVYKLLINYQWKERYCNCESRSYEGRETAFSFRAYLCFIKLIIKNSLFGFSAQFSSIPIVRKHAQKMYTFPMKMIFRIQTTFEIATVILYKEK